MQGICSDASVTGLKVNIAEVKSISSISEDGTSFVIEMKNGTKKIGSTATKGCSKEELGSSHRWFMSAFNSYKEHHQ